MRFLNKSKILQIFLISSRFILTLLCLTIFSYFLSTHEKAFASETDWIFPQAIDSYAYIDPLNILNRDGNIASTNSDAANLKIYNFSQISLPNDADINKVEIRFHLAGSPTTYRFQVNGETECTDHENPGYYKSFSPTSLTILNDYIVDYTSQDCNFNVNGIKAGSYFIRMYRFNSASTAYKIDDISVRFIYTAPTITPNPTVTSTPTPTPFLDLPWDYQGKEQSFNDSALEINSYFDHEYPLLTASWALSEPPEVSNTIMPFMGFPRRSVADGYWYSSHDGYDYGAPANVYNGDPVYPAAPGIAEYKYDKAGGNTIFVDHQNGYQTVYYHLQSTDLIIDQPDIKVPVQRTTVIGRVGSTGLHTSGPHIHIGVFQDKNNDGKFDDNVPDGATDPFGWQPSDKNQQDPWENYSFTYNGQQKTGNKSYYLWKTKLDSLKTYIPTSGGELKIGHFTMDFPQYAVPTEMNIDLQSAPIIQTLLSGKKLFSVGPSFIAKAYDITGTPFDKFLLPFTLNADFSQLNLFTIKPESLSFYSTQDGKTWIKENTIIDLVQKTATATINHFTQFALMGEAADNEVPVTNAQLIGTQGQSHWFRSDVTFKLNATDNEGGLGKEYTLYKIEGKDWETYTQPLQFTNEGHYQISFYSGDKGGNIETVQTITFDIDKTLPEAKMIYDTQKQDIIVSGTDNSGATTIKEVATGKNKEQITIADQAGNTLVIDDKDRTRGSNAVINLLSLNYSGEITILDQNRFLIHYEEDKNGKVKAFKQVHEIKNGEKIKLVYDPKTDKTTITLDKQKTEIVGMKFLQLITEAGTIKYRY